MDLGQLANLGDFIGGVAVLVTLVYLVVQVLQNTSALRAGSAQAFADSINKANAIVASNLDIARHWRLSGEDPGAVAEDEKTCVDTIWLTAFNSFDSALLQAELGSLDKQTHDMIRERVHACLAIHHVRDWWSHNQMVFTKRLVKFVEREGRMGSGALRSEPGSPRIGGECPLTRPLPALPSLLKEDPSWTSWNSGQSANW